MKPTRNPKEPKDGEVAKVIVCKKKRNYSKVLPTRSNKKSTVRDRRYNMHKNVYINFCCVTGYGKYLI